MSEAGGSSTFNSRLSAAIDDICAGVRNGFESIVDGLTPPESARQHFREAHVEMLRGVRAMLDHRIDRLSRQRESA